jgi:hypothetical protein
MGNRVQRPLNNIVFAQAYAMFSSI